MLSSEGCMACQRKAQRHTYPICENIFEDHYWRVCHAFNISLSGWLIIGALRHIETLADISSEEATTLKVIRKTSKALEQVTGAVKIYSIMFAEHRHFRRGERPLAPTRIKCKGRCRFIKNFREDE
jgi:diadenosine tetraphosphate (Ap4A) HIT family hydrolase